MCRRLLSQRDHDEVVIELVALATKTRRQPRKSAASTEAALTR